jgi:hypothetical protein
MKKTKLIAIIGILVLVGIVASNSRQFSSAAKSDEVFNEIGKYKSWKQINKTDEKKESETFAVFDSSVAG